MAFSKRIGSLMSQSFTQNNSVSMLNAIRCMSTQLFVGGLSFLTDDHSLRDAFSSFGEVTEAVVATDRHSFFGEVTVGRDIRERDSGMSRGFGFVTYASDDSAKEALSAMDGQELNGRIIRVCIAPQRPTHLRINEYYIRYLANGGRPLV